MNTFIRFVWFITKLRIAIKSLNHLEEGLFASISSFLSVSCSQVVVISRRALSAIFIHLKTNRSSINVHIYRHKYQQ